VATPPDFYSSLRTQPEAEAGMPVAELIRRMGITEQTFWPLVFRQRQLQRKRVMHGSVQQKPTS